MGNLLSGLKGTLDLLPFNGDKTKLFLILLAYALLKSYFPDLDLGAVLNYVVSNIELPTTGLLAALLHKWLKSRATAK
jgi:hypothetical protein